MREQQVLLISRGLLHRQPKAHRSGLIPKEEVATVELVTTRIDLHLEECMTAEMGGVTVEVMEAALVMKSHLWRQMRHGRPMSRSLWVEVGMEAEAEAAAKVYQAGRDEDYRAGHV